MTERDLVNRYIKERNLANMPLPIEGRLSVKIMRCIGSNIVCGSKTARFVIDPKYGITAQELCDKFQAKGMFPGYTYAPLNDSTIQFGWKSWK